MDRPLNIIGKTIKKIRRQKGITQDMIAARLQLAGWNAKRATVAQIEGELRGVRDYEASLIAHALGVPVGDLYLGKSRLHAKACLFPRK